MKYYVASSVFNFSRVNEVCAVLDALGYDRTYDWTINGDVSGASDETRERVAASEARAVTSAELFILLLPGRFGAHAELGLALASASNKRILVWSETEAPFTGANGFCVFYFHPAVEKLVCPFEELLSLLTRV